MFSARYIDRRPTIFHFYT